MSSENNVSTLAQRHNITHDQGKIIEKVRNASYFKTFFLHLRSIANSQDQPG